MMVTYFRLVLFCLGCCLWVLIIVRVLGSLIVTGFNFCGIVYCFLLCLLVWFVCVVLDGFWTDLFMTCFTDFVVLLVSSLL